MERHGFYGKFLSSFNFRVRYLQSCISLEGSGALAAWYHHFLRRVLRIPNTAEILKAPADAPPGDVQARGEH